MIDWLEHTDPLRLTAYATVAVAIVGVVSILANGFLGWQSRAAAVANRAAVKLQAQELEVIKQQAQLAKDQFDAARAAALPLLRPAIASVGDRFIEGTVAYVHGSEPANEIHIWIRGRAQAGATWGLHTARIGFMSAGDRELPFTAIPASALEQDQSPFPEFLQADLGPHEFMVGITWQHLDGAVQKLAERQSLPSWSAA